MRVIAGSARSVPLKCPQGDHTRPTTDRIKETLFNMIQNEIPGCSFLDLFAGSGQIGIEALSRGASWCVFVENDRAALDCLNDNLKKTKLEGKTSVLKQDTFVALTAMEYKYTFDVVFMDPPYGLNMERRVLEYFTMSRMIDRDSLIIFEASLDEDIAYLDDLGYDLVKEKRYKTNKHVFVRRKSRGSNE
ncbi:MAG: 16S rRNA (guanine(966)-N(2))-methyltransferase RsmD [Lachnospiraceae bacterium]|nr:16S rRNA (guanine(966)-N(2))-methyltransferase RsmD [Lachnospiraceae bacterium]